MQLGDHLGFAGIVMGLIGAGLALLYPQKRWIGGLFLLVALGLSIAWAILSYKERGGTKDESAVQPAPQINVQKELVVSLVQYLQMNRIDEIDDELSLNVRVQAQRQNYLLTKPSLPFNYFQFGLEVIYRAREGNWGGGVISPGMPLSALGAHEWPNEVSFLVRSRKMSEDSLQLKAFSNNLLLPPALKWDLDQYIHAWGVSEEVIADLLNDKAQQGLNFGTLKQDALQQEFFRRYTLPDLLVDKLANDARQYLAAN